MADWINKSKVAEWFKSSKNQAANLGDLEYAKRALQAATRSANLGELEGIRPDDKNDRTISWWGGNFLGAPDEKVPKCSHSDDLMHPVLQIVVDELPCRPTALDGLAVVSLWMDIENDLEWFSAQTGDPLIVKSGRGFEVRTYTSMAGLVPLGPGYREHKTMPCFPIKWHEFHNDLPDWGEFFTEVAPGLPQEFGFDWFYDHAGHREIGELQKDKPIKVGGYPQWWQEPQHVEQGQFVFFLDSTVRGSVGFPAGGSANFFRVGDDWEIRADFT